MDREKIKEQLAGYRPGIYAENDPAIADALAAARDDEELSAWLDGELEFDRAFSRLLRGAPVDRAGMAGLMKAETEQSKTAKKTKGRRMIPLIATLAAVLLLGGFLVKYFCFPPEVTFPAGSQESISQFRDQMSYYATQRFVLEKTTEDLEEARDWLVEKGGTGL